MVAPTTSHFILYHLPCHQHTAVPLQPHWPHFCSFNTPGMSLLLGLCICFPLHGSLSGWYPLFFLLLSSNAAISERLLWRLYILTLLPVFVTLSHISVFIAVATVCSYPSFIVRMSLFIIVTSLRAGATSVLFFTMSCHWQQGSKHLL